MSKSILAIIVVLIFVVGYYLINIYYSGAPESTTPTISSPIETNKVTIANYAFDPPLIKIAKGSVVTWTNEDSALHQIASDPHPTHTDLPGLDSKDLSKGQSYSFTFDKTGTFSYHCHLHPTMKGKVIVVE